MVVDTVVDERTLRELELTGVRAGRARRQPWTVMTAYNRLNGTYCSDDRWLLTEVLRDEWGFDGMVMTDWGGDERPRRGAPGRLRPGDAGQRRAFDAEVIAAVGDGRLDEAASTRPPSGSSSCAGAPGQRPTRRDRRP
jgi:beta-glucosidase